MGMTELALKVKMKIAEQGINQVTLAKQLGCSKENLNNVLAGSKNLRLEEALDHYIKTGQTYKYDFDKEQD